MAHNAVAATFVIGALVVLPVHPLVSLVLFGAAIAVFMNRRGAFGMGISRAMLAFLTALFGGLLGVVTSLLGLVSTEPGGNVFLVPGLLILALSLGLLGWSIAETWRVRGRGGW